jgi:hypothetical protein
MSLVSRWVSEIKFKLLKEAAQSWCPARIALIFQSWCPARIALILFSVLIYFLMWG